MLGPPLAGLLPLPPLAARPSCQLKRDVPADLDPAALTGDRRHLPVLGRFGDEATLIRLAAQLKAAQPWAGRRPAVHAARPREP